MSHTHGCAFVLWTNLFEEVLAAVFTTELRRLGLPVKIVGLHQRRAAGAYGVTLIPDITLEAALQWADAAFCVIIPCNDAGVKRLENDPRLEDFFHHACANDATLVFGAVTESTLATSKLFSATANHILTHPDQEDLVGFVRRVVHSLVAL